MLRSAAIGYPARRPDFDEQGLTLATLTENVFTNAVLLPRTPIARRSPPRRKTYELTAPATRGAKTVSSDFARCTRWRRPRARSPIPKRRTPGDTPKSACSTDTRTLYRRNDLLCPLCPLGGLELLALPGEAYKRALTRGLLDVFGQGLGGGACGDPGGTAGTRIATSRRRPVLDPLGQVFLAPEPAENPRANSRLRSRISSLPHRYRDPFGDNTIVAYDELICWRRFTRTRSATRPGRADYRVLHPHRLPIPTAIARRLASTRWACSPARR